MFKKVILFVLMLTVLANSFYLDSKYKATIQVKAANVYTNDTNVPIAFLFDKGGQHRGGGQDIIVTTLNDVLIARTIDSIGSGEYSIFLKDPAQTSVGGGTKLLVQWGGASVNVANDLTLWQNCHGSTDDYVLIVHGEEVVANLTDESGNYTSTDANITYNQPAKIGNGPCFNGNNTVSDFGDVTQIDSVEFFSILLWVQQNNTNATDYLFRKHNPGASNYYVQSTTAAGNLYFEMGAGSSNYNRFEWASVIDSINFHHVAYIYDGSQPTDALRGKVYINGSSQTPLSTSGTIPAITADLSGFAFTLSNPSLGVDGCEDEFRFFTGILSENQTKTQYDNQNLFSTNGSINVGTVVALSKYNLRKHKFNFNRSWQMFSKRKTRK